MNEVDQSDGKTCEDLARLNGQNNQLEETKTLNLGAPAERAQILAPPCRHRGSKRHNKTSSHIAVIVTLPPSFSVILREDATGKPSWNSWGEKGR